MALNTVCVSDIKFARFSSIFSEGLNLKNMKIMWLQLWNQLLGNQEDGIGKFY